MAGQCMERSYIQTLFHLYIPGSVARLPHPPGEREMPLPGAFSYEIISCGSDDEVANVLTEAAAARKATFGRVVATRVEDLPAIIEPRLPTLVSTFDGWLAMKTDGRLRASTRPRTFAASSTMALQRPSCRSTSRRGVRSCRATAASSSPTRRAVALACRACHVLCTSSRRRCAFLHNHGAMPRCRARAP
jgi:hypothetical protein